jgi:hypothetical protein
MALFFQICGHGFSRCRSQYMESGKIGKTVVAFEPVLDWNAAG